jgi:hypothetical protein
VCLNSGSSTLEMKDWKTHRLWVDLPGIDPALVESLPPPLIAYSDAHTGRYATLASAVNP